MSSDILFLVSFTSFHIMCFVIFYQKIKSREIKNKIKIKYKGSDIMVDYFSSLWYKDWQAYQTLEDSRTGTVQLLVVPNI